MNGKPTGFWGKLRKDGHLVVEWHPLADHCADVAAVGEALLSRTILRQRLARLGGIDDLVPSQTARLCVLMALHDIGKHCVGFQNKSLARPSFVCGHVKEVLALIGPSGYGESVRLMAALPVADLKNWGPGDTALRLLVSAIGHHGRPVAIGGTHQSHHWAQGPEPPREGDGTAKPDRARNGSSFDPFTGIADLVLRTRTWFPEAYAPGGEPLPDTSSFQHGFSGLVMLADWLGSDTRFFEYSKPEDGERFAGARRRASEALRETGLDPAPGRQALGPKSPDFGSVAAFPPRAAQKRVLELPSNPFGSVSVLEAETGSGKTEAALVRFLRLYHAGLVDGMYFALPTRTAASQIYERVVKAVSRAFPDDSTRPPVVLAVPGYLGVDGKRGTPLPHFEVLWNDDLEQRYRYRGWAAEHPKRYLAGSIVVGTIDQVLLSSLEVGHAHLRAAALLRHLLVVDEVHASDAYMTRLLEEVLVHHCAAGGHAFLMSATLGAGARHRLLAAGRGGASIPSLQDAIAAPYPLVSHRPLGDPVVLSAVEVTGDPKRVAVEIVPWMDEPHTVAAAALNAAILGAKVLVVRNTVRGCIASQKAVEALARARGKGDLLFACAGVPAPHHARFAREDRVALDGAIDRSFGKGRALGGCVAVATQTVQQSLDLDADLLITDLCPMDVLLQRIGRLHRHPRERRPEFEPARAIVLSPADRDLSVSIWKDGNARGAHGIGTVYDDLRILEATWRSLSAHPLLRIPDMNRYLVEAATHPEALDAIVAELGETWSRHATTVMGRLLADRRAAQLNLVDWTKLFGEYEYSPRELERRAQTRLGEGDRLVELEAPLPGPFGQLFRKIAIPAYMARGVPPNSVASEARVVGGVIWFSFGPHRFVYDRLGLRPFEEPVSTEEDLADA